MSLTKVQGHTYYFAGATNVGVVRYKSGYSLLIDPGIDSAAARGLVQALSSEGLKPKYIMLTHAHPDHFGAVKYLNEEFSGLRCYAASGEALWMENPEMESRALFGSRPLRELENRYLKGPQVLVDERIQAGSIEIGEKRFELIPLPGHTYDQLGVLTSDRVFYAGDSLFSEEILSKYDFPFLVDVERQLETISRLAETEADYFVLSHAQKVYTSVTDLAAKNKERIDYYLEEIREWCYQPQTREDITEKVLQSSGREVDVAQYHMTFATAGAFLAYLANRKLLEKSVIDGRLYYYRE